MYYYSLLLICFFILNTIYCKEINNNNININNNKQQSIFNNLVNYLSNYFDNIATFLEGIENKLNKESDLIISSMSEGTKVDIPIINISNLINGNEDEKLKVALEIGTACREVGFFVIVGHGVKKEIIDNVWQSTRDFFDLPIEEGKIQYTFADQEAYPFGYSKFGGEILSAGKAAQSGNVPVVEAAPDLKELFSLGPGDGAGFPKRIFPTNPPPFEDTWTLYYDTMANLAAKLLGGFALALDLPENYFEKFINHHASAMRALNYPHMPNYTPVPGQLRASAHTDYGSLTILRSDSSGLQVSKDKSPPTWSDVPFIEDGFIVNLGDLMQRWTNDEW
jgi:isopenicillin N synthase-like dioxygenase